MKSLFRSFPTPPIFDRYILGTLSVTFLFGMGLFSSLGIALGSLLDLVRQVRESQLLLDVALRILLLKIPEFVSFAIPMAALLACLLVYSRLSSDSELIALRSLGLSIYRIVFPAFLFGFVITGGAWFFQDRLVPQSNYEAAITLETALKDRSSTYKEARLLYPEYGDNGFLSRLFYAEEYDGEKMYYLTIIDRSNQGISQIVTARSATWDSKHNIWDFNQGLVYFVDPDGKYRNIMRFNHHQLALPNLGLGNIRTERKYEEMSLTQARDYLRQLIAMGDRAEVQKLRVRIAEKIAFPWIVLVMSLVGAALGIRQQRGRSASFGICLGLIFGYYLVAFIFSALGVAGKLPPLMSAWSPNLLGLAAAIGLLRQVAR